ncbi:mechanosensitive ion channel family protein [Candidatus Uhrbacteria bacterium]|nr:mechanosensitive ion channel family protein [Candidatus Uhrbacteria bacterium]
MLEEIFGSVPSLYGVAAAAGIILAAWVLSGLTLMILKRSKFLTSMTDSTLDDEVMHLMARPIHLGFVFAGGLVAFDYLFPLFAYQGYGYSDLIPVALVVWLAYTLNRLIRGVMDWHEVQAQKEGENVKRGTFGFLNTIISLFVWGLALTFVLNQVGVDISALLAGLGIAGLAVALALQNTLSGLFSAIGLAIDRPVRQGDFVQLEDGTKGFIEDISMRSTRIRTFEQNLVIVPNSKLTNMVIMNAFLPGEEVTLKVPVGVAYGADLDKAESIALEVAESVLEMHKTKGSKNSFVRYKSFGDSAIEMVVFIRVNKFLDQYIVRHDFIKGLQVAFNKAKIEIPFPQRDVHMKK